MAITEAIEEILTITPPPASSLRSSSALKARTAANAPRTLTAKIASNNSSSRPSRSAWATNRVVPAQLTSTSQRPQRPATVAAALCSAALSVTGAAMAKWPLPDSSRVSAAAAASER